MYYVRLTITFGSRHYCHPHFTDEEDEAQRGHRICPESCSEPIAEPGFASKHPNSSACAINHSAILLLSPI